MESASNDSAPNASINEEENRAAAKQVSDDDYSTNATTINGEDRLFIEKLCDLDPTKAFNLAKVVSPLCETFQLVNSGIINLCHIKNLGWI